MPTFSLLWREESDMTLRDHFGIIRQAVTEWSEDNAPTLGAALAYYTVFSLAPLVIITIGLAGLIFGQEAAQGQVFEQVRILLGDQSGRTVQEIVEKASVQESSSTWATVVGGAALIFGASTVFGQLQTSLNIIWGVQPRPDRPWTALITDRVLSFTFILVVGFLLLVSLILTAFIAAIGKWMGGWLPASAAAVQIMNFALSLVVITSLFATIYKYMPDAKIAWRDVWIGSVVTALLFVIGKTALGIYLGTGSVSSSFGAAGSLIALLVWVYYSAQIVFFGAEITQVYAKRFGSHIEPKPGAMLVPKDQLTPT